MPDLTPKLVVSDQLADEPYLNPIETPPGASRLRETLLYFRRNPPLVAGIALLLLIIILWVIGAVKTVPEDARPLSYKPSEPPSAEHWLGTDRLGKDIVGVMVEGTPKTLRIRLIGGAIGATSKGDDRLA